jgi:hypothetical protein
MPFRAAIISAKTTMTTATGAVILAPLMMYGSEPGKITNRIVSHGDSPIEAAAHK